MSALEIFKAGNHTTVSGQKLTFSEADLQASVEAYDPALFAAPLVVGHPDLNDPAYGWVKAVSLNGEVMRAEPEQVESQFAEMVNDGRFPRISASFYHPSSPQNPKPGVWYLRHVGFLGAQAPSVKGLKPASFAAGDANQIVTVEFAAPGTTAGSWALTRFMRGVREYLLESRDSEVADKVIPDWVITSYEEAARETEVEGPVSQAAFAQPEEESMALKPTADFAERETALQSREADLAERERKIKDQEQARRQQDIASFADQLVDDGKLLPRDRDGLVAFMAGLTDSDTVSFAEGETTVSKPCNEWLREFLQCLPQQVDFAERSAAEDEEAAGVASFAAPAGFTVDAERLALHNKALAYQTKHQCDYNTALAAVS